MNQKFFSWTIIFCAALLQTSAYALNQVRLLKTSKHKEIIVLDVGSDYFMDKDPTLAALIDEQTIIGETLGPKKVMVLKALLKNVAVKNQSSAWSIVRLPGSFSYDVGKKYVLLSMEKSLEGRRDYQTSQKKLVTSNLARTIKEYLAERDTETLTHLKDDYILSDHVKTTRSDYDSDFELPNIDTWEGEELLKSKEIFRSPYHDQFSKSKKLETFEKMVGLFIEIYNDPEFNYANYYYAQRRSESDKDFRVDSDQVTGEEQYWINKKKAAANRARYMKEIQSKGESWSEDFNDQELEEAVINIGIESEMQRQTDFSQRRFDHQINLNVGFNLKDNAANTQTSSNRKFHMGVGWEMFPFKKFPSLGKFSFSADMRYALDSIAESSGIAASINEFSLGAYINYYFLDSSQAINRLIPFGGVGIRLGRAGLTTEDNRAGTYNLFSFPSLNLGATYNFRDGQGYRVNLSIETINLSLIEGTNTLTDKVIYEDARLGFAWTKLL